MLPETTVNCFGLMCFQEQNRFQLKGPGRSCFFLISCMQLQSLWNVESVVTHFVTNFQLHAPTTSLASDNSVHVLCTISHSAGCCLRHLCAIAEPILPVFLQYPCDIGDTVVLSLLSMQATASLFFYISKRWLCTSQHKMHHTASFRNLEIVMDI